LKHLTRVIGTIGAFGNVIIVGRGANFILPKEKTFKIRIIAPLEFRIKYIMDDSGYTRAEAEQYVVKRENNGKAFIRKYYNVDVADPKYYDIIINTEKISIGQATESIISAFHQRRSRKRSA
jgi:cytidylate kinase